MADQDDMKESLSAFIDTEAGELESRRVLNEMSKNSGLRHVWERYYLIRAVLKEEFGPASSRDLVGKILKQIDSAPNRVQSVAPLPRITRFISGMAVAASVAALAIVSLQFLNRGQTGQSVESAPPVARAELVGAERLRWDTNQPETESTLNVYLVEHNEFMPTNNIGGMFPYVRVVTYDSDR
jgi:sigma-E factor negative regulatory protein RseA